MAKTGCKPVTSCGLYRLRAVAFDPGYGLRFRVPVPGRKRFADAASTRRAEHLAIPGDIAACPFKTRESV
jgi:hypothetical protein